jgi:hypothetical protein
MLTRKSLPGATEEATGRTMMDFGRSNRWIKVVLTGLIRERGHCETDFETQGAATQIRH